MREPRPTGTGHLRTRAALLSIVGLVHFPAISPAARADDAVPAAQEKLRIERLARLGKLWGNVRYLHPFLAHKAIDWDAALIKVIPKVESAKTRDDFAAAVAEMLGALEDAATAVIRTEANAKPTAGESSPVWSWTDGKILVVRITNYLDLVSDYFRTRMKAETLKAEIGKSDGVVFDLRALTPGTGSGVMADFFQVLGNSLVARELTGPGERALVHSGYSPQTGMTSGGYFSSFMTREATRFVPEAGARARRVAFIVNARSELPPVALALQGSGDGAVIAEGPISDAAFVTTTQVDLGEGIIARVRVTEYVAGPQCPAEIRADTEVAASAAEGPSIPSYDAALKFVRRGADFKKGAKNLRPPLPAVATFRPDKTYKGSEFPGRELRLLAAIRFWNVIAYFFPYKHLIGEDWDAVLVQFLPRLEAAQNAREYALAVAEMATHTHDSHVNVRAKALSDYFGTGSPPVWLREIEGEPVVTGLGTDRSVKASGIEVGDVVLKVDGEPVHDRIKRLGRYITSSTPQAHAYMVMNRVLLTGAPGSSVVLTVRDRDGRERERKLPRSPRGNFSASGKSGEVLKILEGNIGYADLTRLSVAAVDGMFERFKDTSALIFDMRGYPLGTAWAIAPRINTKGTQNAADFRRPLVGALTDGSYQFFQPIPNRLGKPLYRGKTVMLIDERAISQSEHTGLFFEAANDTTFIGSPTMGANGDVTTLTLPGDIVVSFSGHDVRHANGRQLQRVGLVPHIEARPTIQGIRDGRDEVLERARRFLLETDKKAGEKNGA
jgi:C-terminal processing protease CtpA/Prc